MTGFIYSSTASPLEILTQDSDVAEMTQLLLQLRPRDIPLPLAPSALTLTASNALGQGSHSAASHT